MGDNRLPKAIFCSELEEGTRSCSGQRKRYKETLKANLKHCNIAPPELEELILDRSDWWSHCKTSVQQFEAGRVRTLETKQEQRKTGTYLNAASFPCDVCGRYCASRIGLPCTSSHSPTNLSLLWSKIRRVDGSVHHHCWLGLLTCKSVCQIAYAVLAGTLNTAQSI